MDTERIEQWAKALSDFATRRGVLRLAAALPAAGALATLVEAAGAAKRNGDEVTAERHKKRKKRCKPKPRGVTCAGRCGIVQNNCKKKVNCGPCCTVCPSGCEFATVQAAVDAAPEGSTVRVCAGTFTGDAGRVVIGKNVTLIGAGKEETRLSGEGASDQRVVDVAPGAVVTIRGPTVTGGKHAAEAGGGVRNQGRLTLVDCLIGENSAVVGGGVFNHDGSVLTLEECTVGANSASDLGGGIYDSTGAALTLRGSTVTHNSAEHGGGLYSHDASVSMTDTTITGNTASRGGGGMRVYDGSVVLTRCRLEKNTASSPSGGAGGGAYVSNGGTLTLDDSDVTENTAIVGGGILNLASTVTLLNGATVTDNQWGNCSGDPVPGCSG
jgi:hypothetical protein